jgi:hypothetical protein
MQPSVNINTDCADCTFILAIRVFFLMGKLMQALVLLL